MANLFPRFNGCTRALILATIPVAAFAQSGSSQVNFKQAGGSFTNVQAVLQTSARVTDYGVASSSVEQTSKIQTAINTAAANGFSGLQFPVGTYVFSSITIPGNFSLVCGDGTRPDSHSTGNFALLKGNSASGAMISLGTNKFGQNIQGCVIDGGNTALIGVMIDTNPETVISSNVFRNFPASAIAIKGGSALYSYVTNNTFAINGSAWDFQNSFGTVHAGYGCNDCWFTHNIVSASRGVRVSGNNYINYNDFEAQINDTAIVQWANDILASGTFIGNYIEVPSGGSASPQIVLASSQGSLSIQANKFIGPNAAGYSIYFTGGKMTGGSIRDNAFGAFQTAIGNFGLSADNTEINIAGNSYASFVSAPVSAGTFAFNFTTNQTSNTSARSGGVFNGYLPAYGNIRGAADVPAYSRIVGGSTTLLNVSYCTVCQLWDTLTLSGITGNVTIGNHFWVAGNGAATLANSGFHLAANRDVVVPSKTVLEFVVSDEGMTSGVLHEVGSESENIPTTVGALGSGLTKGDHAYVTDANGTPGTCAAGAELGADFLSDYRVRQPKSATFAQHALGHVVRVIGGLMAVDITDRTVVKYQTDRLKEKAAQKTINDEVGFLLRILPTAQAGAVRAQLRKQKQLKLKGGKRVGKAYSTDEKANLIEAAKSAPRSKAVYLGTMFALHAGMRHKEVRTIQWNRLNLDTRIVTVGESKTEAGSGRTIPLNDDLFSAVVEYTRWYTERFGTVQPDWYVFPFGKPRPSDPTRPQTTLRTAWRNVRTKAKVEGRFHDNRHTFVTDLAESGAGDEVIRDMAGHVSKEMLKHYSHIRTLAKRNAVGALSRKPKAEDASISRPDSEGIPQDSPQVTVLQ